MIDDDYNIKLIDYLYSYTNDKPIIINTYPPPEHLFFLEDSSLHLKIDEIYDQSHMTYNYISLGIICIDLFTKTSFINHYHHFLISKSNTMLSAIIRYAIASFVMDKQNADDKLKVYDFGKWKNLFVSIANKESIDANCYDTSIQLILNDILKYINLFSKEPLDIFKSKRYVEINYDNLNKFVSKLLKFNYKERHIDTTVFDTILSNVISQ
jgi:hypothetical protein